MKEIELKYFRQEDVQKADSLADDSKENKVAFKEELKKFYLAEDARLKESQKANLQNFKDAYLQEVAEIEKTHQQSLADAKAEHDKNLPSDPSKVKEFEKNYSDVIKGIDTVSKRAKIKALNTYDENTKNEKLKRYDLQNEYVTIYKRMGLSSVGKDNLMLKVLENKADINIRRTLTSKKTYINLVPLFMLVLIIVAYYIGKACTGYQGNLGDVINNGIFVAVVATGAVYIYSQGGFDMSLGSSALTCAIVAALTWNATKNIFLSVLLAVLLGCGLGIVNAIFATMLNLPVMVMTLTMMNILAAVNEAVLGAEGGLITVTGGLPRDAWVYAIFLAAFFVICWTLFNYSKLGRRNKFIGSNKKAAKFNGIDLMKAGMISFGISGIGLGICGFLFVASNSLPSSSGSFGATTVLGQVGLNVIIAIVFGGMTTSGGPKSKVSCAIIGAFFSVFLDEFFAAISTPTFQVGDYCYMAKGIIFIIVSLANMWDTRTKNLASGGSIQ